MVPPVGSVNPAIIRRVVVLPQPLPPNRAIISPWATCRSIPSTAVKSPKRLTRLFSSNVAIPLPPYFTNISSPTSFSISTMRTREARMSRVEMAAKVGSKVSSI